MLRYGFEIFQELIKMFVRTNKRFPNPQENKFLQNQALRVRESLFDRGVNMEELSAEDAIKVFSKPPKRRKPPTAEIYKPLEFGKKSKPKEGLETLDEAKVFDQFRDENTLTNLYRTQEQALAGGDIDTSRKIQKQIDAIINKEPLSDFAKGGVVGGKKDEEEEIEDDDPGMFDDLFDRMFGEYELEKLKKSGRKPNADGGRVGMMAGGITKIKKLLDLAKKTKSKLGEASKTDLKKVRARAAADKKSTEDLAKSEQIPVRDDTVKVKGETLDDGTPDYEYYSELLDDAENQFVKGDETLEQLEAMLKEKDDYMKYMYGQYKAGKLGSKIGDDVKNISDTEIAKAYKQAREGNDLDLNDDKYDAQIIADYLSNNLYKTDFYDLPQDAQLDIYDKSLTWLMDDKMEKAMRAAKPMKGPIDMTTGKNMITGEKVIDVDYIPGESPLPKKRTLNADGGLATLFEERG